MTHTTTYIEAAQSHLESALEAAEPAEKDFHIRHALQLTMADDRTVPTA